MANAFTRYRYTNPNNLLDPTDATRPSAPRQVFTARDMHVFFNNRAVGNMESLTYSVNVEVVPGFTFGSADAKWHAKGKRMIVGSMVLAQFDRDAILDEIFQLRERNIRNIGDLWEKAFSQTPTAAIAARNKPSTFVTPGGSVRSYLDTNDFAPLNLASNFEDGDRRLREQMYLAARRTAMTALDYPDQLPPFDITVVGVNNSGGMARCHLRGVSINQYTTGYTMNDIGASVGMSFVALSARRWSNFTPEEAGGSQFFEFGGE